MAKHIYPAFLERLQELLLEAEPLPPRPPGGDSLAWGIRNLKVDLGIASAEDFQPDDRDRLRRKWGEQLNQDPTFGETP